jgi:MoaA/NifB/PqqE/SkfB family radical SAM enzyme|tara:strand:+ start:251 stop:493 length:243 start_codon:yes stop_codon:yes gene_type:complete
MGILYDNGDVYSCEILENAFIGNIREYDYDFCKLWSTNKAESLRKEIKNGCYCTFECAMASSILFNPRYLAKIGLKALGV